MHVVSRHAGCKIILFETGEVEAIRKRLHLGRTEFAKHFGFSVDDVRH